MAQLGEVCEPFAAPLVSPPELFQLAWGCGEAWASKGLCLSNPEMHIYFNFISLILQPLNDFNTMLQAEESRIGYLKNKITILVRKFLGKFVKAKVIKSAVNITDSDCQLHDNIIAVGVTTRAYIVDHADEISSSTLSMFFTPIRKFYESLTAKMQSFHSRTLCFKPEVPQPQNPRRLAAIYSYRPVQTVSFRNT